jgi:hypothetical protein
MHQFCLCFYDLPVGFWNCVVFSYMMENKVLIIYQICLFLTLIDMFHWVIFIVVYVSKPLLLVRLCDHAIVESCCHFSKVVCFKVDDLNSETSIVEAHILTQSKNCMQNNISTCYTSKPPLTSNHWKIIPRRITLTIEVLPWERGTKRSRFSRV